MKIDEVKFVDKPWGHERWISCAPDHRYALKEIFIRAPYRSSIQFHKVKQESIYIQSGKGILYYSKEPIDINRFVDGKYTDDEISEMIDKLVEQELTSGTVFHVEPHFLHRVAAVEDIVLIEASTLELDDVMRLADDTGRVSIEPPADRNKEAAEKLFSEVFDE